MFFSCANLDNDDLWVNVNMCWFQIIDISKLWIVGWPSWFCVFSFQMQFTSNRKNSYLERRYVNKYLNVFVSWSPYWFYGFLLMWIVFWWILAWLIQQLVWGIKLWHNHALNLLQVDYTCLQSIDVCKLTKFY
jgi:hypothetical protein